MITHRDPSTGRRPVRRAAQVVLTAAALVLTSAVLTPALADTPAAWPEEPHVSGWDYIVVLLLIPLGVFVLVWLAVTIPAFRRSHGQASGEPWGDRREWFGGPRRGVESADDLTPEAIEASEQSTGGASGRW